MLKQRRHVPTSAPRSTLIRTIILFGSFDHTRIAQRFSQRLEISASRQDAVLLHEINNAVGKIARALVARVKNQLRIDWRLIR
jgi:hypothetical protein